MRPLRSRGCYHASEPKSIGAESSKIERLFLTSTSTAARAAVQTQRTATRGSDHPPRKFEELQADGRDASVCRLSKTALRLRLEIERHAIDAIAQACRRRPVGEDVPH